MGDLMKSLTEIYEGCSLAISVSNRKGNPLIRMKLNEITGFEMRSFVQENFMTAKLKNEFIPKKPFDEIRQEMTDIGNGIFKKTLTEGYGCRPMKEESQLTLLYSIYIENANSVYDSTYLAQRVCLLVLGKVDGILPGFDRALRSMCNQEKAAFIVPRLLYAEDGEPPTEEELKDAYIIIELLRVTDPEDTDEKSHILTNSALALKHVEELREKGKAAFTARFYRVAVEEYMEAVFVLRNVFMLTLEDNEKRLELLMRMYLNAGVVFNKMEQFNFALYMLNHATELLEKDVKAAPTLKGKIYLHASRSLRLLNYSSADLTRAFTYLEEARKSLGNIKDVKDEFKLLYQSFKHHIMKVAFFVDPVKQALGEDNEIETWLTGTSNSKTKIFEAAFEQMLKTFLCSHQEKKKTVYGVSNEKNIKMAKEVVAKNKKVMLQVLQNKDTVSYVLTKK